MRAMDYSATQYEIINLGNNHIVGLMEMVRALESLLGMKADLEFLPEQPGDVPQTWADVIKAERLLGYRPGTEFADGLRRFVEWIRSDDTFIERIT
ncbi:hypothetical protein [Methanothrix sp.]|uniref:hypothetical protein n=1 Tax=Methanothrix sp. TaxID=90426 RepID=UPI003C74C5D3